MFRNAQLQGTLRAVIWHFFLSILVMGAALSATTSRATAAEYAALVMDARNGKVLHASNADTRLHPASLTKMMTLYIAFEAIENGEIDLDTLVTVSRNAAAEPPSKLGLRAGQKIKLRFLIRAAAIKSANDASTAIAEAIEGSEAAFARRMNRTAQALGMSRTTFKNAHGLTQAGHLSTARDMTILGRHVFYDYPQYYNIFSRKTADAGIATVRHTNTRFLTDYPGADGIKTGYTSAAGFNLTASAQRGSERIITTVFGGRSTQTRNAKVAELMTLGFKRAPSRVATVKPKRPPYMGTSSGTVMVAGNQDAPRTASKIIRVSINIDTSLVPKARPTTALSPEAETILASTTDDILLALSAQEAQPEPTAPQAPAQLASQKPVLRPSPVAQEPEAEPPLQLVVASPETPELTNVETVSSPQEVVTRISTSGDRDWGVTVGTYTSEFEARKMLLRTALSEIDMLDDALRKVVPSDNGFDANFLGMTREMAEMTCRRLSARGTPCETTGPT